MGKLLFFILISIVIISGCVQQSSDIEENIIGGDKPSVPIDLILSVSEFSDQKITDVKLKVGKREGYPKERVNWKNVVIKTSLPEGLELIEGELGWVGDIVGDEVIELNGKIKAIKEGEWKLEVNAIYYLDEDNWYGDAERVYIVVDDTISINDFPQSAYQNLTGQEEIIEELVTEKPKIVEVDMTARQFKFEPNTITVNKGDTVKLTITSKDVTHGFGLDAFNIDERIESGKTIEIEFVADKTGEFEFRCTVICGAGHSGMQGTLIVKG